MQYRNAVITLAVALAAAAGIGTAIGFDTTRAGAAEAAGACRFTLERGPAGVDRAGRPVENWIVTCNHLPPPATDATLPMRRVSR